MDGQEDRKEEGTKKEREREQNVTERKGGTKAMNEEGRVSGGEKEKDKVWKQTKKTN